MSKRRSINIASHTAKVAARSSTFPVREQRYNEGGTNLEQRFICQTSTSEKLQSSLHASSVDFQVSKSLK